MNYEKRMPSRPPSVYSHVTSRSSANLRSGTSLKSLKIPWYQKPLIQNAIFMDVQRSAFYTGIFTLLLALFTVVTSIFDIYCHIMALPGSTHYGYHVFSYEFVYVGNKHVRNALVMFAVFSTLLSFIVFVTSIFLIIGVRKEHEKKMVPWLYTFFVFCLFRVLANLFSNIVNDNIFAYNRLMVTFWLIFLAFSIYGWIIVYSFYIELSELTKLEDLAHLRSIER
ncbi:PREDICTED: uncharacterized protein LOC108563481 isoform X2 [Nicrophorus vespilloides]|uniref:Uncharacterized protein LOC108563481 isoform X2 n=1 Tax=Nicrophorus vespilloides TaxID=110193 RepID=A0ABM1MSW2_NICVS|nr:PREDICTED: uncharacterized protein LOC108563481 isoform X2 [Nicrophorus vespilloides]